MANPEIPFVLHGVRQFGTNQPVVNGERLTPRRVKWGDGSFDEMCLNYITVVEPFEPAGSKSPVSNRVVNNAVMTTPLPVFRRV